MNELKEMTIDFDLCFLYRGERILDGPLYFILMNLRQGNMSPEFIKYLKQSLYAHQLERIGEFLGERVDLNASGFPSGLVELMERFERERKGVRDLLRHGRPPALTVDGVIFRDGKLLLIRRKNEPFKGMHALPGGFVDYGERTEEAVVREMKEETGLETSIRSLVGVYSDPLRDPRGHTISTVYLLDIEGGSLREGDDAVAVELVDPDALPPLAFDHEIVVKDALAIWRSGGPA